MARKKPGPKPEPEPEPEPALVPAPANPPSVGGRFLDLSAHEDCLEEIHRRVTASGFLSLVMSHGWRGNIPLKVYAVKSDPGAGHPVHISEQRKDFFKPVVYRTDRCAYFTSQDDAAAFAKLAGDIVWLLVEHKRLLDLFRSMANHV